MGAGGHIWIDEPPERSGRFAGVLLEWRRVSTGWVACVAYTVRDIDGRVVLVQRWLPASHITART